jgi:hypothetical protein
MAKTLKERQAEFRAKMYAKGFKQRQIWVDKDGTPVAGAGETVAAYRTKEYDALIRELNKLIDPMSGAEKKRALRQTAAYLKTLRKDGL